MKPGLMDITRYFLWLGTVGFGGPIALVGYMHRDLVEQRKWFTEEEYQDGLALSQLAPGPLAAQLATYLGWAAHGVRGATLAAVAFVLPSLLMVLVLSVLYVRYGGMPWMTGAFYGVGAAVIGIIAYSSMRLARKTVGRDTLLWIILLVNAAFTAITATEKLSILLLSGALFVLVRARPNFKSFNGAAALIFLPVAAATAPLWLTIFSFFFKASLVVFGSGLAVVPFLYGGVVEDFHWLTDSQFLDAIAVSMITPGPVVITVAFIGYLVDGLVGASAAALGMFLPVYLVVVLLAPFYHRIRERVSVRIFVQGITAGATGALLGAVVVLGQRAIVDWITLVFFAMSFVLLLLPFKIPEPLIIIVAAVVGIALR